MMNIGISIRSSVINHRLRLVLLLLDLQLQTILLQAYNSTLLSKGQEYYMNFLYDIPSSIFSSPSLSNFQYKKQVYIEITYDLSNLTLKGILIGTLSKLSPIDIIKSKVIHYLPNTIIQLLTREQELKTYFSKFFEQGIVAFLIAL